MLLVYMHQQILLPLVFMAANVTEMYVSFFMFLMSFQVCRSVTFVLTSCTGNGAAERNSYMTT